MCELFGISSIRKVPAGELLREFFSHSADHPNGWGMAVFYGGSVSLEKEPISAERSVYLRERLRHKIEARNMIAHIRLATRGNQDYENCHPFVARDSSGRTWTLAHNGTIFDCPALNGYVHTQEGQTDSERILCHIVEKVNEEQKRMERPLTSFERFNLLDWTVSMASPHNKLNLLIYDGDVLYVHTNYADSLYVKEAPGTAIFSTVPLDRGNWRPVPMTTMLAYQDGEEVCRGVSHGHVYIDDPYDTRLLFVDYAGL